MGTAQVLFIVLAVSGALVGIRRYLLLRMRSDFWILLGGFVGLPPSLMGLKLLVAEFTPVILLVHIILFLPAASGVCMMLYGEYLRTIAEKGDWEGLRRRFGTVRVALGLVPRDAASQVSAAPRYVADRKRVLLFSLLGLPAWYFISVTANRILEMPMLLSLCFNAVYFVLGIYASSLRPEGKTAGEDGS